MAGPDPPVLLPSSLLHKHSCKIMRDEESSNQNQRERGFGFAVSPLHHLAGRRERPKDVITDHQSMGTNYFPELLCFFFLTSLLWWTYQLFLLSWQWLVQSLLQNVKGLFLLISNSRFHLSDHSYSYFHPRRTQHIIYVMSTVYLCHCGPS